MCVCVCAMFYGAATQTKQQPKSVSQGGERTIKLQRVLERSTGTQETGVNHRAEAGVNRQKQ